MRFVLCAQCHRHVKSSEHDCPFCGALVSSPDLTGRLDLQGSRDRSALLFGVAVASAIAVSACNHPSSGGDGITTDDTATPQARDASAPSHTAHVTVYGGPHAQDNAALEALLTALDGGTLPPSAVPSASPTTAPTASTPKSAK